MMTIDPKTIPLPALIAYLQGSVTPRPIALVSSVDVKGNVNLSPFSFFNVFSLNPPVLVFSPSRRVRDNSTKHTFDNVSVVKEVVINIVNYAMVQQTSLSSTEYERSVNEFVKSGLTPVPSDRVKPPRVAESPVSFECSVRQIVPLADTPGAGNLVICDVLLMHISESVLDEKHHIDPFKLDAVSRLGGDWYGRVQGSSIFSVPKPLVQKGIGVDQIPEDIRLSKVLTGNDLGMLGNVEVLPDGESVRLYAMSIATIVARGKDAVHHHAHQLLEEGNVVDAWKALLGFYLR